MSYHPQRSGRSYTARVASVSLDLPAPRVGSAGLGGLVVTPRSKVRRPAARPGQLRRSALIARLEESRCELVLVLAPAGSGKTILVSQWAADAGRPVAWATVTETDGDAVVLMSTLLTALTAAGATIVPPAGVLTADEPSFSRRVLPQFQRALEQVDRPVTLVVDDVHAMAGVKAAVVLTAALESLPDGSRLALVGRSRPDLPVALWRSQGRVLEVGAEDLAFDAAETAELLTGLVGAQPPQELVADVRAATAGWPVAVYLQGQTAARGQLPPATASTAFTEYLDTVVLADVDPALVDFLRRTSVLPSMSAPYCDEVLERTDSRNRLRDAEQATLLVTRLEGAGGYYRLHPLLRDHLANQLTESEPSTASSLHARAARWCESHGYGEDAIVHAARSGDLDLFGALVWAHAPGALVVGRYSTVRGWLSHASDADVEASATLSITAAWSAVLKADGAGALRWAQAAATALGPDWKNCLNRSTVEPSLALLLALPGTAGFDASAAMAGAAHRALPPTHPLRALALLINGCYLLLTGAVEDGQATIELSRDLARSMNLGTTWVGSSTMLAVLAVQRGAWPDAEEAIAVARDVWAEHDLDDVSTTAWFSAVSAYLHARAGMERRALADLRRVQSMVSGIRPLLPWLHVLVESFVARTYAELGDDASAATAVRRAHDVLHRVPASFFLTSLVVSAEHALLRSDVLSRLTPAEPRLWPYVMRRSTLREIAVELSLSPETVKTEVRSIYRKLGVSSRRELQDLADTLSPTLQD